MTEEREKELVRLRQMAALKAAAGAWKSSDHPELKRGSEKWVRKLREESERRIKTAALLLPGTPSRLPGGHGSEPAS